MLLITVEIGLHLFKIALTLKTGGILLTVCTHKIFEAGAIILTSCYILFAIQINQCKKKTKNDDIFYETSTARTSEPFPTVLVFVFLSHVSHI